MKALFIEPSADTPAMNFDEKTSILHIIGRSIPEDPDEFYAPMREWIKEYLAVPGNNLDLQVVLEYINSGSAKLILEILRELDELNGENNKVKIQWFYEPGDESIQELGEHFSEAVQIPLKLVEIE